MAGAGTTGQGGAAGAGGASSTTSMTGGGGAPDGGCIPIGTTVTSGTNATVGTTTGCNPGPGGRDGSGGAGGRPPRDPDAGPPPNSTGIVIRNGDIPWPDSSSGTGSTSVTTTGQGGSGPGTDPDTKFVILGNAPLTCGDPYRFGACDRWRVSIGIPPALFRPGVLALDSTDIVSSMSVSGPDRGGGDCYSGFGSFNQGTIEIVSVSSTDVVVRLQNTFIFEVDADGVYHAAPCP
jgi:hypothetical protein